MRLIDACALLKQIPGYNPVKYTYECGDVVTVQDINSIPTIDAVLVVRCADCKYWNEECYYCSIMNHRTYGNFFCACGERSADGE